MAALSLLILTGSLFMPSTGFWMTVSCLADTGAADRIKRGEILLSNIEYKPGILTRLELKPQQAVVVKCLEE